jgi:hypothetical protein
MARSIASRSIDMDEFFTPEGTADAVAEAVRSCGAPDEFADTVRRLKAARFEHVDIALTMLPMLQRFATSGLSRLVPEILKRFMETETQTRYGLFNAVTSVARDTPDPRSRWDLESLGGGLIVETPSPAQDFDGAEAGVDDRDHPASVAGRNRRRTPVPCTGDREGLETIVTAC